MCTVWLCSKHLLFQQKLHKSLGFIFSGLNFTSESIYEIVFFKHGDLYYIKAWWGLSLWGFNKLGCVRVCVKPKIIECMDLTEWSCGEETRSCYKAGLRAAQQPNSNWPRLEILSWWHDNITVTMWCWLDSNSGNSSSTPPSLKLTWECLNDENLICLC